MKKVLFVASTEIHIRNFHLPYLQAFHQRGWEVHVACGPGSGEIPGADRCLRLPFEKKMTSPRNLRAMRLLGRTMRQERYDLLLCHTSLAAFFARAALLGWKERPAVCNMVHGYLFDENTAPAKRLLLTAAEKLCAPVTDRVITMNRYDEAYAIRHRLAGQVDFVHGIGLDGERFRTPDEQSGQRLREELGFDREDVLLLYGAEFSARKSQRVLLEALPRLPERVKLLLPGDGSLREACRTLARTLGVEHRVRFPGHVKNMDCWYAAADAAVSASRSEGLPFNILEAMAHGLPVIASAVKGHTDLICDGVSGRLYPYGDREALAAAVRQLLEEPERFRCFAAAGREESGKYALNQVRETIMDLYLTTKRCTIR